MQRMCAAKIIQAELIGHSAVDGVPCVVLYVVDEQKRVLRVDSVLLERELAKPADPTRMLPIGVSALCYSLIELKKFWQWLRIWTNPNRNRLQSNFYGNSRYP